MKFRTQIEITPQERGIDYSDSILSVGSCFASSIGARLQRAHFDCAINPTGVLYNPLSIAETISRYNSGERVKCEQMHLSSNGVWFHYGMHGSLSDECQDYAVDNINSAIETGHSAMQSSNWVILTLGSAFVYRFKESGEVVANCHRQPSKLFSREILSVSEVVDVLGSLVEGALKGKRVVLTLSPIRHLGDGLEHNSLSKAILRVAISELVRRYDSVNYFPSYEILLDDLRDYRFYDEDMVHPSTSAVDYIWQSFVHSFIAPLERDKMEQVERIVKASQHRPLRRFSEEYAVFCRRNIELISCLDGVDMSCEREHFIKELKEISEK